MTCLLAIAATALATSAHDAAEAGDVGASLEAGAAPLLSPLALVALGACLVAFAMLRTRFRHSSK